MARGAHAGLLSVDAGSLGRHGGLLGAMFDDALLGRHYHGVTPVTGAASRWTMGGFVARALGDPGRVLFWS